jgi:hypothetical protein
MIRTIRAETIAAAVMVTVAILRPACAHAEDIALSLVNPKGRIDGKHPVRTALQS